METLHTGLYSDKAFTLLSKVFSWGTTTYCPGHRRSLRYNEYNTCKVIREPSNEVVITTKNDSYSWYRWNNITLDKLNSQDAAKKWLAIFLKVAVLKDFHYATDNSIYGHTFYNFPEKGLAWKRTCKYPVSSINAYCGSKFHSSEGQFSETNFTIADFYLIYDMLLNRKHVENKWSKKVLKEMTGEENDPIKTEMEVTRREEAKKLKAAYNADIAKLREDEQAEIRKIRDEIERKYFDLRRDRQIKYATECTELTASFNLMCV